MMHPIRRLRALALAALALVATTLAPSLAAATSVVRIEWLQIANGAPGTPSTFYGEQRLSVTGSTPVSSSAAPTFPPGAGVARVTVISGAVVAAWGASPTSSESGGIRLEQGDEKDIVLSSGQFLSFVEALDPASGQAVTVTGGATYPPDAAGNGTLNSATLNAA
ncbi:MAG TPA: hypothetical protein VGS12_07505, partial [Caulobacteraceae bacterium]|nr:hypothetical protein [Caulobacteraceae bacterium]